MKAARQEQHVAATTTAEDGPAVHRLRMIVAHLQSPALSTPTKPLSRGDSNSRHMERVGIREKPEFLSLDKDLHCYIIVVGGRAQ